MKRTIQKTATDTTFTLSLTLMQAMPVLTVTEDEMATHGKEATAGNIFTQFLCTIVFPKIGQKIDGLISSLGINIRHAGGSMMTEFMIAAKELTPARNISTGGAFHGGFYRGGSTSNCYGMNLASFLPGGLAGAVSRQFFQSVINSVTGQSGDPVSRKTPESSLKKGGESANKVAGAAVQGSISYMGSVKEAQAVQALTPYMEQTGTVNASSYSDVEIGGGRITGTGTSIEHPNSTPSVVCHINQYMALEGNYEAMTATGQTI